MLEKLLNGAVGLACLIPIGLGIAFFVSVCLRHRRLTRAVASLGPELDNIVHMVEQVGTEPPTAAFLCAAGKTTAGAKTLVRLPHNLENFPWGGKCVTLNVDARKTSSLAFIENDYKDILVKGTACRAVSVPRTKLKSGKAKNIYDIAKIIAASPALEAKLTEIFPSEPASLLGRILSGDGRIGGSPEWYQTPEFPKCDECKKSMGLILQIEVRGAMVYLFGCRNHIESTQSICQYD